MDTLEAYDEGVAVFSDSVDDGASVSFVVVCIVVSGTMVEDVYVSCV